MAKFDQFRSRFKKLVKFGMTQPTWSVRNQLGDNRIDTDTRYETLIESVKTRWTCLSSRDDSINSVKIRKSNLLNTKNQKI